MELFSRDPSVTSLMFPHGTTAPRPALPRHHISLGRNADMLWTIAIILLVLWLLGFSFGVAGGLIHALLVIAIIIGLIQLFTGRRVI